MRKYLKLISLLLVVALTIGVINTQYFPDNSTKKQKNELTVDYENCVVNDMRDVHICSKRQLKSLWTVYHIAKGLIKK